jgi:CubicO group peptidase (beta-lactamase class C family)
VQNNHSSFRFVLNSRKEKYKGAVLRRVLFYSGISAMTIFFSAAASSGPVFFDSGPQAKEYGADRGYPVPEPNSTLTKAYMIGFYTHFDKTQRMSAVRTARPASRLFRETDEISSVYHFGGDQRTIRDYVAHNPIMGLLILKGDRILFEHYQYARTDEDKFLSQSMVKTIIGLLTGIAISEGYIRSIDDLASFYVPELIGTEYGATPIRALLEMKSGMAFAERYDGEDDNEKLGHALFPPDSPGPVRAIGQFTQRVAPPGTKFNYSGADTELLGLIVSRAVHMSLSEFLSSRIWQKLGAEADAAWALDASGHEIAYCCFTATLRDWGRLGAMISNDGFWNGTQIVPKRWLTESTTPTKLDTVGIGQTAMRFGYGYHLWTFNHRPGMIALRGVHGQAIYVDPASKLVLVQTAVYEAPEVASDSDELSTLWNAVLAENAAASAN